MRLVAPISECDKRNKTRIRHFSLEFLLEVAFLSYQHSAPVMVQIRSRLTPKSSHVYSYCLRGVFQKEI